MSKLRVDRLKSVVDMVLLDSIRGESLRESARYRAATTPYLNDAERRFILEHFRVEETCNVE